jgi:ArsR family transcriptional regulator, lead/cadmium/zinc/bismuth-responsive transcriptional repressor
MLQPSAGDQSQTIDAADCDITIVHLEAVQRVRQATPNIETMQQVAAMFQILADPTRAQIVTALAHEELCVCDVAAVVGISISAVSHQLKRLRDQGVVQYRKEGRLAFYRLSDNHIRRLVQDAVDHIQQRS